MRTTRRENTNQSTKSKHNIMYWGWIVEIGSNGLFKLRLDPAALSSKRGEKGGRERNWRNEENCELRSSTGPEQNK